MITGPVLGYALALVPLTILFFILSLLKTTLRSLSNVSIRRLADEGSERQRRHLEQYLENPGEFVLHLQMMIQIALVAIAVLVTAVEIEVSASHPVLKAGAFVAAVVILFEHFFPRYVMSTQREPLLLRLFPAYELLGPLVRALGRPLSAVFRTILRQPAKEANGGEPSDEDIQAFIDVGEQAGILQGDEGEMLESLVDFGDTIVREVMTPRVDIVGVDIERTVREARDIIIESKHSRLPAFRERVDNIEGIVDIRDLLEAWRDGREAEGIQQLVRPILFVPETKKVSSLLKELQQGRQTFAIVVDEFGGTSGLVTMEDVVEEIVGEIEEDHEDTDDDVIRDDDGSYLISAKLELERLEEIFDFEVKERDYGTVGGLVFSVLGRVPAVGEEFEHLGLSFRVVNADQRRVNRVRVIRRAAASPESVEQEA